jgi:membrane-bound lytic murein transglycosylase D
VNFMTLLNMYIAANLLLVLAAAGVAGMRMLNGRLQQPIACRHQVLIGYALTMAVLLLPFTALLPVQAEVFEPNAQVWSGATMREVGASGEHRLALATASQVSVPLQAARIVTLGLLLGCALPFLWLLSQDVLRMRRIIAGADCIARRGSVRVVATEAASVPFSFWLPGQHVIVVPSELMLRPRDLHIALRHEAQHHRQLDTKLVYVYQLLRAMFFVNPAMHWLHKSITELQEFACDEALLVQRKVSPAAYCSCLLRVAEAAVRQQRAVICASMLGSALRSRVEAVLRRPAAQRAPAGAIVLASCLLAVMAGVAVAATGTIQDRRISMEQATAMAVQAQAGSDFPIMVNQRVLEQLNRLLGTPDGRTFVRESLARMTQHQELIAQKTAQYGLPAELLAVPLAESGFRNLPRGANPAHGAGIWMFIEPTARGFGLTVNNSVDERLDVPAETDAAMRMFAGLHQTFADWGLALLAYNTGSRGVQQAIDATGSRDVWQLIDQGYENDPDYVARVMAAVLIIRNPSVID